MNYSEFLESKMTIAPESGFELCREALIRVAREMDT